MWNTDATQDPATLSPPLSISETITTLLYSVSSYNASVSANICTMMTNWSSCGGYIVVTYRLKV